MSYTGFDASLSQKAKSNLKAAFSKDEKGFSVHLNVSPNGKSSKVEEEFRKAVSRLFKQHRTEGMVVKNATAEIDLHSFDTMFDFTNTHLNSYFFRKLLEDMGFERTGIVIRHVKDKEVFINVECRFTEASPLDFLYQEGE